MFDNLILLTDIVETAPLPIAVYVTDELKIEIANPAMITTWGKGEGVIGKSYKEILPELENQQIFDQVLSVLKSGVAFHAKNARVDLVINDVLRIHYFNYSFTPLYASDGKIYGVMNTATDVTDLNLAQQQIRSSDERLRMALDSSGMGTYEIDLHTQKINTSGNFNEIWSVEGEIINEELISKLHPEDQIVRQKAHEEALLTGKMSYEARIINDNNSFRWVKINGKIIKDENGNPNAIIGIVQCIHEQREFSDELKKQVEESTEELRRSNDDLLHFANVVSHDLKEPVRKMKIFNELLRNDIETNFSKSSKKYLDKVYHSAERMQTIIEGILSYSTINKKTQPVENINLDAIIENTKIDLELIIKEKDAKIIASKLPDIEGAPILIQQLFYNLINNALKFSKANQQPIVTIASVIINKDDKELLQISIKDNGIGLDSSHYEKIFTAFERLHSKDQYEGNGLGLALCRKIVKRHNGDIRAIGEKDNGAEFIITLPLKQFKATL